MVKKSLIALVIMLMAGQTAFSQVRFGVKGGLNFTDYESIKKESIKDSWNSQQGFHAGVLLNIKTQFGLAFQPEILFSRNGATIKDGKVTYSEVHMDYIEVPLNIQLGIDIVNFRPFIEAAPYVSYAIGQNIKINEIKIDHSWADTDRFDAGIGLGGGFDYGHFQVTAKYNWGLCKLNDLKDQTIESTKEAIRGRKNRSLQISVAFMF